MPIRRSLLVLALLALAPLAAAQAPQPIEKQMTAEEFAATGLGKLDPRELANLNAWLNRTLEVETQKAAAQAKDLVQQENRGFFDFGSDEPIEATMVGEFRGFAQGRQYTLDNGQVWRQTDNASLAGVRRSNPKVRIKPGMIGNVWYLGIEGYNTRAKVQRIK